MSSFGQSSLDVSYSDLAGGEAGAYVCTNLCTLTWGDGNIDMDPNFVGGGDYHLIPFRLVSMRLRTLMHRMWTLTVTRGPCNRASIWARTKHPLCPTPMKTASTLVKTTARLYSTRARKMETRTISATCVTIARTIPIRNRPTAILTASAMCVIRIMTMTPSQTMSTIARWSPIRSGGRRFRTEPVMYVTTV